MDASFGSIYGQMLSTASCGSQNAACHNSQSITNTGITLDYSLDASAVWRELLGDAGTGQIAENLAGDASILRVAPFDAGASMLYVKLTLTTSSDPRYGSGMPFTAPGSVCPEARAAVEAWINAGAPQN
jgi:hypothetical protein